MVHIFETVIRCERQQKLDASLRQCNLTVLVKLKMLSNLRKTPLDFFQSLSCLSLSDAAPFIHLILYFCLLYLSVYLAFNNPHSSPIYCCPL